MRWSPDCRMTSRRSPVLRRLLAERGVEEPARADAAAALAAAG